MESEGQSATKYKNSERYITGAVGKQRLAEAGREGIGCAIVLDVFARIHTRFTAVHFLGRASSDTITVVDLFRRVRTSRLFYHAQETAVRIPTTTTKCH